MSALAPEPGDHSIAEKHVRIFLILLVFPYAHDRIELWNQRYQAQFERYLAAHADQRVTYDDAAIKELFAAVTSYVPAQLAA